MWAYQILVMSMYDIKRIGHILNSKTQNNIFRGHFQFSIDMCVTIKLDS